MKAYITRYALTTGIEKVDCEQLVPSTIKVNAKFGSYLVGVGDWHETLEAATAKAEAMRAKRIASLKAQIEKLEKLDFTKV